MTYIIFDLEATCWEHRVPMDSMEIIEIGAVRLGVDMLPKDEFASFVRPVVNPALSDFCKSLTTIEQESVDKAEDFKTVFPRFVSWAGAGPVTLCSWGAYDKKQLGIDCARHGLSLPPNLDPHINLKALFAERYTVKPCGMVKALRMLQLPLDGTQHRGIDDAKNILKIARVLLRSGQ